MWEFLLLVLCIFFTSLSQSHCRCPRYFSNSETIESILGDNMTLTCNVEGLKRCDSVVWYNLTNRANLPCDPRTCDLQSKNCPECIVPIHNLQHYHTGPYSCLCEKPFKKTKLCIEVIPLCQIWTEINHRRTDYFGSVSLTSSESPRYVEVYEHDSLAVGCLPGSVLQGNCSSSPEPDVTMVMDWCYFTCIHHGESKKSCMVDIIIRVSPSLTTLPTPTSTYQPPSTPKVTAVYDVITSPPLPSTTSHAQTALVDFFSFSTTSSKGSVDRIGASEPSGIPRLHLDPQKIVFFLISSVSVSVLLLLIAITFLRIYLLYFKAQDKDKGNIYRLDSVYRYHSTVSEESDEGEVKNGDIPHQQQPISV